jgi:hypothetical protein
MDLLRSLLLHPSMDLAATSTSTSASKGHAAVGERLLCICTPLGGYTAAWAKEAPCSARSQRG